MAIIFRDETIETVRVGDGYEFTGTLIVVSDVGDFVYPGAKAEISLYHKMGDQVKGVHALKVLGVRDLYYRLQDRIQGCWGPGKRKQWSPFQLINIY